MTPFERRRQILSYLQEQPGIKVTELAQLLDVSEGTIRNDLTELQNDGHLRRVRGGAVLRYGHRLLSPPFAARAQTNAEAKQWIARRAADMVQDGDSILLDASSTVFAMVPHLKSCRNLTIVTNGIEVSLALAENPSHTVILLGGMVRPDGTSVVGHLGKKILDDLHVKTAFVSCSGLSVDAGLTEIDIQEVQTKCAMIHCAEHVIALVDSTKFGKVDLTSFADLSEIAHLLTDKGIAPHFVEQVRQAGTVLTVCGESTVSSLSPNVHEDNHYQIGFANLGETMAFPIDVRHSLEEAAQKVGGIDLVTADNQLDGSVALEVADRLIEKGVDLVIEYQIDESVGGLIMDKFNRAGIPVIAIDIPMVGATYFGVDHYRAGHMAGVALGKWAQEHWEGSFDHLIILEEHRPGALPAARIQGQIDGLQGIVGQVPPSKIIHLDSGNTTEISQANVLKALAELPDKHRLAIICFNDDASFGAIRAARQLDRESDIVIAGQGADRNVRPEIRHPDSRLIGSTAYWPERYGPRLIDVALKILRGEPVPPAVYNEHVFVTPENIDKFYPASKEKSVPEHSDP